MAKHHFRLNLEEQKPATFVFKLLVVIKRTSLLFHYRSIIPIEPLSVTVVLWFKEGFRLATYRSSKYLGGNFGLSVSRSLSVKNAQFFHCKISCVIFATNWLVKSV